jgi:predicted ATPase
VLHRTSERCRSRRWGVLRALAASGPVIVAIDDVQWLDAPSARVLAFVVRRLEDAPIRILVALRVGSGGDPLGLGRTDPLPLHRVPIGPLGEEAMTRLLRDRAEGDLARPILLRLHRISEGNPLFATMVGGVVAAAGRTTASEPDAGELNLQAPWADPSCRELIALPKRGWVCESHRP